MTLQALQDVPKARREVDLHYRASVCDHIVKIIDVYENTYNERKCLLIVMEWFVPDLSTQFLFVYDVEYLISTERIQYIMQNWWESTQRKTSFEGRG